MRELSRAAKDRKAWTRRARALSAVGLSVAFIPLAIAGEWPSWRGPEQNGVSRDTGLPERWTPEGENVIWRMPHGGRSAPIVMNGRVYLLNLGGSGSTVQERLLCFDAETGHLHWERRFTVFLCDAPSSSLGWASPAGDPETGYVYIHGTQGLLVCLDRDGKFVWQRSLHEEYGRASDRWGRTAAPVVDADLVIISFVNASWGDQSTPGHRYAAFDKRTGAVVWWSEPGGRPLEITGSTPIVATVNGSRLLIGGGADGAIHAVQARTGVKVWDFALSRGGIGGAVVAASGSVFACHGAENLDSITRGRIVAIDASGKGDVTRTHEKWRLDDVAAGVSSPALEDGKLLVFDGPSRLLSIEAETGKVLWRSRVGRSVRASPVIADGKIFAGEESGRFSILHPTDAGCTAVSEVRLPTGVQGSAAVANGRVYFVTRDELYCLGFKAWSGLRGAAPALPREEPPAAGAVPVHLALSPADLVLYPGQSAVLTARLFDANGRFLRASRASWSLDRIKGSVTETGRFTSDKGSGAAEGRVVARVDALTGAARVRIVQPMPFTADFETLDDGTSPPGWIGGAANLVGATFQGQKVLRLVADHPQAPTAETFFGLPDWRGYTLEADVLGIESRGNLPDVALVSSGYQLVLQGNLARLRLVAWAGQSRLDRSAPFALKPAVWYRMKLRSDQQGETGLVRGMVWPRDAAEPEKWTLEAQDPLPSPGGSPGIQAYAAGVTAGSPGAGAYFDNVRVTRNSPEGK